MLYRFPAPSLQKGVKIVSLGEKLKGLRQKRDMNQTQLADASGITQATISRIESGEVKQLKSEALKKLAEALEVTVDYLVGKTNKLTPSDIVDSDPTARQIFRGYDKLSPTEKNQVKDFVGFLEKQKKRKRKASDEDTETIL